MTKLIVDPLSLLLEFPKASESKSYRIRILGQVVEYDDVTATLKIRKVPNVPKLYTEINLIEDDAPEKYTLNLDVTGVLHTLTKESISVGAIVNIVGYYDGKEVNVIECYTVNGSSVIPPNNVKVLTEISSLKDFD